MVSKALLKGWPIIPAGFVGAMASEPPIVVPPVLRPIADNVRPVATAAFDSTGTAQNSLLTVQNGTTLFGLSIAAGETRTFGWKLRDGIGGGQGALWLAFGGYGDFTMAAAYSTDATDLTTGTWIDVPYTLQAPDGLSGADKFAESGQLVNLPDLPAGAIVRCRITAGSTSVNVSPAVYSSTPEVWAIVGPSLSGISVRTTTLHDDMTAARAGMGPIIIKWCRGAYDGPEVKGLVDEVIRKVPRFTAAFLDIGGNDVSVARPYASDANPTRMASAFAGAVAALKAAGKRIFTGPITYRNYPVDGSKPAVNGLAARQNGSQPYNVNTMVAPIRDGLPEMWDADLGIWQGDLYDRFLYNWSTVVGADGIHFADGTQYPIYKQDIVRHRNYAKTLVWPAHYLVAQIAARKAAGSQTQEQKDRALAAIADWPAAQNADQSARRNALIADVNGTQVGGATTIFADTFTGTNGDALPGRLPQVGAAWQGSGGVIDNNRLRNAGTTTNAQVPTEPPTADYEVRARIYKAGDRAAQGVFVSARWASENNHYRAGYSGPDGAWIIQKVVGGTATTIGTTKAATLATGTNYDIVFKLVGTALKLTVDGVLSCEATDGDLTAKGLGGIKWTGANSSTTTGHHFVVATAVVPAPAPATVPAKMAAPVLTASPNAISVDRANSTADGGSAITRYDLRYGTDGTDGTNYTVAEQTADPQSITGLVNRAAYRVSTRAVNAVGPGAWSDDATATPMAAQATPYNDDFQRPDQNLEVDPRYVVQPGSAAGSMGIVGGQLKTLANAGANGHVNLVEAQPADFAIEWRIIGSGSGVDSLIKVRQSSGGSFLGLRVRNGSFQAISVVNGALSTVGTATAPAEAVVKAEVIGSVLRFFVSGAVRGSDVTLPAELLDGRTAGYQNRDNTDPAIAEYVSITPITSFSG